LPGKEKALEVYPGRVEKAVVAAERVAG